MSELLYKALPDMNSIPEEIQRFSSIKLIVTDIDGTLLSEKTETYENIIKYIEYFKNFGGIKTTVATGRTYAKAIKIIENLKISKNIPIILYNGSIIIQNESIRKKHVISKMAFNAILELKNLCEILAFYCKEENIYCKEEILYFGKNFEELDDFEGIKLYHDFDNVLLGEEPCAILIKNYNQNILKKLEKIEGISATKSGAKYIEIRPQNINKGSATMDVLDLLNITKEEVLAIGDNDNDIELFESVGISIAVNNASENAKRASTYVTQTDADKGIMEIFDTIRRSLRYFKRR